MNLIEKLVNHHEMEEQIEKEILRDFLNKFEPIKEFLVENEIQSFVFESEDNCEISSHVKGDLYFQLVSILAIFINECREWKDRKFHLCYYNDSVSLTVMRTDTDNYSLFSIHHNYERQING